MTRVYETRGRCRKAAAKHLGIGPTLFDELVDQGQMPQPRMFGARVIWDVYELDDAYEQAPKRGQEPLMSAIEDRWNRIAA